MLAFRAFDYIIGLVSPKTQCQLRPAKQTVWGDGRAAAMRTERSFEFGLRTSACLVGPCPSEPDCAQPATSYRLDEEELILREGVCVEPVDHERGRIVELELGPPP